MNAGRNSRCSCWEAIQYQLKTTERLNERAAVGTLSHVPPRRRFAYSNNSAARVLVAPQDLLHRRVARRGDRPLHHLMIRSGHLFWPDLVCHLVNRSSKLERQLVAVIHGRPCVHADVQ